MHPAGTVRQFLKSQISARVCFRETDEAAAESGHWLRQISDRPGIFHHTSNPHKTDGTHDRKINIQGTLIKYN